MKKQIKQLLFVLSAAVFGGFLLAFIMIMFYGPSGNYIAGQTILSPDIIEKIYFKDTHPKTGQNVPFTFDHNEFVYFDYLRGIWQQKQISLQSYAAFYQYISNDSSLEGVKEEILALFQQSSPTALITTVRTDVSPIAKAFQVIQLTKEDYYRVKLQGQGDEGKWAYFYHSGLYQTTMTLFTADTKA
ncbi:MAG: hypothetical protein ACHQUC_08475 [Chlamydiales bacterium]